MSHSQENTGHSYHKETSELNDNIDQMDLADFYTAFHLNTVKYIVFLAAHAIVSKIDHILRHRENVYK